VASKEKVPKTQRSWDLQPPGTSPSQQYLPGSSKNLTTVPHASAFSKQLREAVEAEAAAATANLSPCSTVLFCSDETQMAYGYKVTILRADRNGIFPVPAFTSPSEKDSCSKQVF
jgi:hypothetical protein